MDTDDEDRLLKPCEVAQLLRVDPKTVSRWAADGKLGRVKTPGGHNRFRQSEVRAVLERHGVTGVEALLATVLRHDAAPRITAASVASHGLRPGASVRGT